MKMSKRMAAKADSPLCEALAQAKGDDVLSAVMLLGSEESDSGISDDDRIDPAHFTSRTEYRKKLIEQRSADVKSEIGETINKLSDLSLNPRGGKIGRAIVVEGPARQIAAALDMPSVRHASLDRRVRLIEPRRQKTAH